MKNQLALISAAVLTVQIMWMGSTFGNHCILYDQPTNTVNVICGSARLSDINEQLVNSSILSRDSKTIWTLNANLVIGNTANFNINSTDTSWLKINSTTSQSTHHIEILGDMHIDSAKITSWNSTSGNYSLTNGIVPRAYIVIPGAATGRTYIHNSEIGYLGYNSTLREGLVYYGGSGGELENNTIHDLWRAPYSKGEHGIKMANNHFYQNDGHFYKLSSNLQDIRSPAPDIIDPLIAITNPTFNATIPDTTIKAEGTSFDNSGGIKNIQVLIEKYPTTHDTFNYQIAIPAAPGNWSHWSIPLKVKETGTYRILAMVTDDAGNENWAEVLVNIPSIMHEVSTSSHPKSRIAFVQPSFTEGAYNVGGFYTFYPTYNSTLPGKAVTTDLSNLTAVVPEELVDEKFYRPLVHEVQKFMPGAAVSIIRNEDVYNGYIFRPNGSNAYDVLFLLHNEYATRHDYNNFRQFVANGGTIVFLDGNVFYGEIYYNKAMHTVTLFKGHDWLFNGKVAVKGVHEGYYDENKEWVGSNFLYGDISAPITFTANPFNYTHFEENYVSNPNATILYDYRAQIPSSQLYSNNLTGSLLKTKIATYELSYGKGKVIMMGIYTQNLNGNKKFLEFFDHIILPRALGQSYRYVNTANGNSTFAYWWMNTGKVTNMSVENQSNMVKVTLERTKQKEDNLMLTLPSNLVGGSQDSGARNFNVIVGDKEVVDYKQTADDIETGFEIPLSANATTVQISMTTEVEIQEGASKATNNEFYVPQVIDIPRGTVVSWVNNDVEIHTRFRHCVMHYPSYCDNNKLSR